MDPQSNYIANAIKSLQTLSYMISDIIENLVSNLEQSAPDSEELSYVKGKYIVAVNRFSNYVSNENLTNEKFSKEAKDIIKLVNVILQNFAKGILPIIEKYQLQNSIPNITKLPQVVTKTIEDVQTYLDNANRTIDAGTSYIQTTMGNKGSSQNQAISSANTSYNRYQSSGGSGGLFNPYANSSNSNNSFNSQTTQESMDLFNEGITDAIISTVANTVSKGLRLITFRKDSLNQAMKATHGNIHSLRNSIVQNFKTGMTFNDVKNFFKSEALWKSIAGVATIAVLTYGLYKLVTKAVQAVKRFFGKESYE